MRNILVKPLLTEKSSFLSGLDKAKYGFVVNYSANKIQIAAVIEKKYNVTVLDVNTMRVKGKTKTQFRKGGRFSGKTSNFKKAFVTLKAGDKIELFEQA